MAVGSNDHFLDFGQSYRKAADYCVIQDRCNSEIRNKLKYWNISESFVDEILSKLTEEGFLNEQRFASNYAHGKFSIIGWGKIKIASELKQKGIAQDLIQKALTAIDNDEYTVYLRLIVDKKLKQLGNNTAINRQKAMFFAASKGFEMNFIAYILKNNNSQDL